MGEVWWRQLIRSCSDTPEGAEEAISTTEKYIARYRQHEVRVMIGVVILLAILWSVFCAIPVGRHPDNLSTIGSVVVGVVLAIVALLLAVALRATAWKVGYWLLVLFGLFLLEFAGLYWSIGTKKDFTENLSHLDAAYYALGTVSTAGTGNIYAKSQLARGMQLAEMCLGMVLVLVVAASVVARFTSDRP